MKEFAALATGRSLSNQPAGLKEGDLPLLLQVSLVANHQDDNGRAGQRPRVCQPVGQTIEGLPGKLMMKLGVILVV